MNQEEKNKYFSKNHYGSTIGLVFGVLALLSYCSEAGRGVEPKVYMFVLGFVTILGSLAYRSAKVRTLKDAKHPKLRLVLEITAIVVILAFIGLQKNLAYKIQDNPVPYFIAPLWSIIAYLIISFRKAKIGP